MKYGIDLTHEFRAAHKARKRNRLMAQACAALFLCVFTVFIITANLSALSTMFIGVFGALGFRYLLKP